jgi:hypothetical protein
VLPRAYHHPAIGLERLRIALISGDRLIELRYPVVSVSRRHVPVLRTAVPEAPVDENGDSDAGKDNIRTHRATGEGDPIVDPEAQSGAMQG